MRLHTQLTLLLVFVAVVPVAVSGVSSASLAHAALEQMVEGRLMAQADKLGEEADALVSNALLELRLGSSMAPLTGLSDQEQTGLLWLIYRQHDGFNIVALFDADGEGVLEPVFTGNSPEDPTLQGREPVDATELQAFAQRVPLAAALEAGAAVGPPYMVANKAHGLIALAVAVAFGDGRKCVVAVELSLARLHHALRAAVEDLGGVAFLVDSAGRPFASVAGPAHEHLRIRRNVPATLASAIGGTVSTVKRVTRAIWADAEMVAAHARLDRLPWTCVLAVPEAEAFSPARTIVQQSVFWVVVALLCAVVAGMVLSRGISGPVDELVKAAQAFQRGEFSHRAPKLQLGELKRLGDAFNVMASQVQKRDEELKAFNLELQKRVDDRTRDLKDAQEQLIHSQKMAAVGELGAGVAHEINNPLTGLLGLIQLRALRGHEDSAELKTALKDMEREAIRIRDIVHSLMELAPQKGNTDTLVDMNRVVEAALSLLARPIVESRIRVTKDLDSSLPKVRARSADLQQAVFALLSNAQLAMPHGGELTVTTRNVDGKLVKLMVRDTGVGIQPEILGRIFEPFFTTRPGPDAKGMGLALVHRVIQDHGARITVDSTPGAGATFTVNVPAARERAHLV
jgi:signal transduction histidine kinase